MQSLTVLQLQNMLVAFCDHIISQKQKINSINVFPVPDQDTGSNLSVTFNGIKKEIEGKTYSSVTALGDAVERTALYSAQGNSGIIFTGFISGFFETLKNAQSITPQALHKAFKMGSYKARQSIETPQEGTILDVMDKVVECSGKMCSDNNCTIETMLHESFIDGSKALKETQEKMAILRESKVVDAGALAFVMMLESFYENITGKKLTIVQEDEEPAHLTQNSSDISVNRYEVVFIVDNSLVDQDGIKEMLSSLGDSIDIVAVSGSMKVHVHTDQPQMVKEIAYSLGTISFLRLEDMKEMKVLELFDTKKNEK